MKQSVGCGVLVLGVMLSGCGDPHPPGLSAQRDEQKGGEAPVASTAPSPPPTVSSRTEPDAPLPLYQVVRRNTHNTPFKTQIDLHAVVSGSLTEQGLKQLLYKIYDDESASSEVGHWEGNQTQAFIYLYTSRADVQSGREQWIARLMRSGAQTPIETEVKTALVAQLHAKPEAGAGLSESQRKEVLKAVRLAEQRADADARRMHPVPDHLKPGYSKAAARQQVQRQSEASSALRQEYRAEVAERFGITISELRDICVDALKQNLLTP